MTVRDVPASSPKNIRSALARVQTSGFHHGIAAMGLSTNNAMIRKVKG